MRNHRPAGPRPAGPPGARGDGAAAFPGPPHGYAGPVHRAEPLSSPRQRRYDDWLTTTAADLLAHDGRLRGLAVRVRFDGGVAHLTGEVDDADDLRRVREAIGRLAGVHAVWDRIRVAGREPVIIDIGCGDTLQYPGNIGFDRRPGGSVAAVADLAQGLPVADATVDQIFAVHVLEHLTDFLRLVDECHRALRPAGVLHVLSPWWRHVNAVADPTHVRFFDVQTVKGICARPGPVPRWRPQHASCDGATVFADLVALGPADPEPDAGHLARFFD
ncbi:Methyltransferase domain-containing protein [Micromonospora pattaloongensis]|uniref:Methyltransferase domain-containing protein n=1 Tax=Micromonospora pattaloongensis TaxID=405436 RepID=A0A1H3RS85_9ACTN|nr:BON domain-containing protein [Micromonospora pattaloongensis]SDZ28557.1 Methyltransferase domain-containing protein [Micromonospora pattaloongensis]